MSDGKARRGFASMTPERRREIASLGGKSAQAQGKAHRWDSEEAQAAGRKGGRAMVESRGSEYMREIGTKGGRAKAGSARRVAGGTDAEG